MELSNSEAEYLLRHVTLPPQLPQKDDWNERCCDCLVQFTVEVLSDYIAQGSLNEDGFSRARKMLYSMARVMSGGAVNGNALANEINQLSSGDSFPIHIREQNAALIFRRTAYDLQVECFESSAHPVDVITTNGALLWSFPTDTVSIPWDIASTFTFRTKISKFLADASIECMQSMLPKASKAGVAQPEARNPANPKLIAQMFMNVLVAYGRVRDDVIWKSALNPWRRNPLWLVLRLGLQASFQYSSASGITEYKSFMVYYICRLCELAMALQLNPDLVQIASAKVARRIRKLGSTGSMAAKFSLATSQKARTYLESDWNKKQTAFHHTLDSKLELVFKPEDLELKLPNSRMYIEGVLDSTSTSTCHQTFVPDHAVFVVSASQLPDIKALLATCAHDIALSDVDTWVSRYLDHWTTSKLSMPDDSDCEQLGNLLSTYYRNCVILYQACPDLLSAAILTCLELWQALDRLVTAQHPLLKEYSPDIPVAFLEPLLLTRMDLLRRLHRFEVYLTDRHRLSKSRNPSIYTSPSANSFTVMYYSQSAQHRKLRLRIDEEALRQRNQTKEQHKVKLQQCRELKRKANAMQCNNVLSNRRNMYHDKNRCQKCVTNQEANNIMLDVHEWPLPSDPIQYSAAIVELAIPVSFAIWRDITYEIQGLGRTSACGEQAPMMELLRHPALIDFREIRYSPQVILASKVKPFISSHYRSKHVENPIGDFLVPCGVFYESYNEAEQTWLSSRSMVDMRTQFDYCHDLTVKTSSLQSEGYQYQSLHEYSQTTTCFTNEVLSDQSLCSPALTLHEFDAYGNLRSGTSIQWYNILRELTQPNLSWKEIGVYNLVFQAVHQVECQAEASVLRQAHYVFEDHHFCEALNRVLDIFVDRVQANWNEVNCIAIATELLLKNLSMSTSANAQARSSYVLNRIRSVTQGWVEDLMMRLFEAEKDVQIAKAQHDLIYVACICKRTFDRDEDNIQGGLASDNDVACYIKCSIIIRDNRPHDLTFLPQFMKRSLLRDQILSHRLRSHIWEAVRSSRWSIDSAVRQIWHHYNPSTWAPWEIIAGDRWIATKTNESQVVHYDLLSGQLLVGGKPLGRLPDLYFKHPTYARIFRNRVLDVLVTSQAGMEYMTQKHIHGYQVFFAMHDKELIIQTRKNGETLELMPHHKMRGDLPKLFIEEHTHWINLKTRIIELRPLASLWKSCPQNWCIKYEDDAKAIMQQGTCQLVDWHSETFEAIRQRLVGIECKDFLHVMKCSSRGLIVRLPRYNFHFELSNSMKTLRCPELGAVIESDQNLGTLIGLRSRLILKEEGLGVRSVLIPIGKVVYGSSASSHVEVKIDTSDLRSVRYCNYHIDDILHRLRGPPRLFQGYYLAYLHALTSYMLADPLTGLTGTEQALGILQQACMLPTEPLRKDEKVLLEAIGKLTPVRKYYPPHLKKMQNVFWDSQLSAMSQHDDFIHVVRQLYDHSLAIEHFHITTTSKSEVLGSREEDHLLVRARTRNASYRNFAFGGNWLSTRKDKVYGLRDPDIHSEAAQHVFEAACLLRERPTQMEVCDDMWKVVRSWSTVSGPDATFGSLGSLTEFELPKSWASLYSYCRQHRTSDHALQLSIIIGTIALTSKRGSDFGMLRTLIALTVARPSITMPQLPPYDSYDLKDGVAPVESDLSQYMINTAQSYDFANTSIESEIEVQSASLAHHYMSKWPCAFPGGPLSGGGYHRLSLRQVKEYVLSKFDTCHKNYCLHRHITELQSTLNVVQSSFSVPKVPDVLSVNIAPQDVTKSVSAIPLLGILKHVEPAGSWKSLTVPSVLIAGRLAMPVRSRSTSKSDQLAELLKEMRDSGDLIQSIYSNSLCASQARYLDDVELVTPSEFPWSEDVLLANLQSWKIYLSDILTVIVNTVKSSRGEVGRIEELARLGPNLRPINFLAILGGAEFHDLSVPWRNLLLKYGHALVQSQRVRRLISFMRSKQLLAFYKESEHGGQQGWSASDVPSWLVLEADNDFMIRPVQAQVARRMLSSGGKGNSVLQLNMGDGKSSVIMPMVILALSNGTRLARAVVLESLAKPMRYMLRQTIGRILQRPVCFLPFSRSTILDVSVVSQMISLQQEFLKKQGVVLAQPEHMMSFELIGIERLWAKDMELSNAIFRASAISKSICWDIVDECDAILIDNQLIYTVGSQQTVQGGSERWKTIQQILSMAMAHAEDCQAKHPQHVELFSNGPGTFPQLRMSDAKAGKFLARAIADDLQHDTLLNINYPCLPNKLQHAILTFVKERDIAPDVLQAVETHFADRPVLFDKLLVIRGFVASEVLYFLLESKRWRVEYGLYPKRCLMAVPYIAKDVPSPRAEFGHPDIALSLTCLAYYYNGLTSDQLLSCFERLRSVGDPSIIYDEWVSASSLSDHLKSECNINLEDDRQWADVVYPGLRDQKAVVDYFLNHFVFPKEAKEFPKKLPASGWDIPSQQQNTSTVGFSGTNDSNTLLPKSITPQNLPELMSTTARVLTYALQPPNGYLCAESSSEHRLSVLELLKLIHSQMPKITVLLDAGAQVLELKNHQVVKEWLKLSEEFDAAIYYDERLEEMTVAKRDGTTEPLISSIYNAQADRCLVYLDQVRTRGTDLRLPSGTRAAVTISRRLGKDAAMQAFMRLRDFGHRHSVLVLAPPEIDREIRALRDSLRPGINSALGMSDVLRWLFKQTVRNLTISMPGWVEQGLSHRRRLLAANALKIYDQDISLQELPETDIRELLDAWEEQEAKSLQSLYSPSRGSQLLEWMNPSDATLAGDTTYNETIAVGRRLSLHDHDIASRQQTYQREVELEVEVLRAIERPPKVEAEIPKLDNAISTFVRTGQLSLTSFATMTVSFALRKFSFAKPPATQRTAWSKYLRISEDFMTTIKSKSSIDEYVNPVNWVLTTTSKKTQQVWLVISPFEANALLNLIRNSKHVQRHVYAPTIRRIRPFAADTMKFFNISASIDTLDPDPVLRRELALFAGGLYLSSYSEYLELLEHIRIHNGPGHPHGLAGPYLDLIRSILEMRRKGEDFSRTHMGKILAERKLTEKDFE